MISKNDIAISQSDFNRFGCPKCGYLIPEVFESWIPSTTMPSTCCECGAKFIILANGVNESSIGVKRYGETDFYYPQLSAHPRDGIPKHGKPDNPPSNGEYFASALSIAILDNNVSRVNIFGCISCIPAGVRIVNMFKDAGIKITRSQFINNYESLDIYADAIYESDFDLLCLAIEDNGGVISKELIERNVTIKPPSSD